MMPIEESRPWEPWSFQEQLRLARYVCDEAEESFPVAEHVSFLVRTREDRVELITAVYESLANLAEDQRIYYAIEEYHPQEAAQQVRSPRKIREARRGTCLDLTLLFSGICLELRLCPVVVVTRDHAFALVGLERAVGTPLTREEEMPLADGPVRDAQILRNLVESDLYLALECTGFAAVKDGTGVRPPLTLGEAIEKGKENLNMELRFGLDIASARYKLGQPGYPDREGEPVWPSLRRRWVRWEEARRAEIAFQEQIERNVIESPVLSHFESFLLAAPWHAKIAGLVSSISRTPADGEILGLQRRLAKVDISAGYAEILARLKDALANPAGWKALQNRIARLERETGLSHEPIPYDRAGEEWVAELTRLRKMRAAILGLQDEVRAPRYQRCLLLLGETGAGKSHLSTNFRPDLTAPVSAPGQERMPSPDTDWRSLVLWVRPSDPGGSSVREKIEEAVRRITGHAWESLEAFQGYLDRMEMELEAPMSKGKGDAGYGVPRLVIVLDDFDDWLRRQEGLHRELEDLILSTTRLYAVYWVVMIQHTSFADVAPHNEFWTRFAWLPPEPEGEGASIPTIGAWMNLDALNQTRRLGIAVIEAVMFEEDPNPPRLEIDSGSSTERDLSNPQIAWTFLNCRQDIPVSDLANLNFIEFVKRFWQVRQRRIDSTPLDPETLYRLAGIAGALMVESLGFLPRLNALVAAVATRETGKSALQDRNTAEAGMRILEVIGLLETDREKDEYGGISYLRLRNMFFWCYRIAEYLFPRLADQTRNVETLLPKSADRDLREGVFEFLLLLAGDHGGVSRGAGAGSPGYAGPPALGRERAVQLWQAAAATSGSQCIAAWLGAPKADVQTQRVVIGAARHHLPENGREIFAFLYFLGEASPEALSPVERIAPLRTLFQQIAAAQLEEYFLHVLAKVLGWIESREELLALLNELAGVEVLRRTRDVGDLVANAIVLLCEKDFEVVLRWLIDYARQESGRIEGNEEAPAPPPSERDEGKHFLREFVFFCTLSLAAERGRTNSPAELFEILTRASWYDPQPLGVMTRIRYEMETQANVVLGYLYRHSRGKKKDYESLIARLVSGERRREQNLAFFLIRHTEVTRGKLGILVNPVFHNSLHDLFLNETREVQKTVEKFYEDFRVNLEHSFDFADLEGQRRAIIRRQEASQGRRRVAVDRPRDKRRGNRRRPPSGRPGPRAGPSRGGGSSMRGGRRRRRRR